MRGYGGCYRLIMMILPAETREAGGYAYRSITIDGDEIEVFDWI